MLSLGAAAGGVGSGLVKLAALAQDTAVGQGIVLAFGLRF